MEISISGPADITNKRFQESARRQIIRAFGNYSGSIISIDVELSEELSQDDPQWYCQIVVQMLGFGFVTSEAWNKHRLTAIIRAADRARQKMFSQLNRPWRQIV